MTTQKNVGWVRPEAVTHQTKTVGYAALTHPTNCAHLFVDIKARSECLPRTVAKLIGPGKVPQPVAPMFEVTWAVAVVNRIAPFSQHGGLGKVHQLFGDKLNTIIEELNETLAA